MITRRPLGGRGRRAFGALATPYEMGLQRIRSLAPAAFYHGSNWTIDTGNAEAGSQVSQWTDLSGNGRHATQSTQDDQPTTGVAAVGDSYLLFDNDDGTSGDGLRANAIGAALSNLSGATIALAWRRLDATAAFVLSVTRTATATARLAVSHSSNGIKFALDAGSGFGECPRPSQDADSLVVIRYDGTATDADPATQNAKRLKMAINGVAQTVTFTGDIASATLDAGFVEIGRTTSLSSPTDAWFHSLVIVPRCISDAEFAELHSAYKSLSAWYRAI